MDIRIKDSFTKIEKIWFHYKKQNDVNIKQSEMKIWQRQRKHKICRLAEKCESN